MNFKIYTIIAALALPMAASAQNTERKLCDFESADAYRSIKVYDTWENSPFRNNSVEGNIQVVQNHLNDADPVRGLPPIPRAISSPCNARASAATRSAHS